MAMADHAPAPWRPATVVTLAELAAEAGITMEQAWEALDDAFANPNFSGGVSQSADGAVMLAGPAEWVRWSIAKLKEQA